jgi:hypothetical protein
MGGACFGERRGNAGGIGVRRQRAEDRGQKTENRRQKTEDRRQRTEGRAESSKLKAQSEFRVASWGLIEAGLYHWDADFMAMFSIF